MPTDYEYGSHACMNARGGGGRPRRCTNGPLAHDAAMRGWWTGAGRI